MSRAPSCTRAIALCVAVLAIAHGAAAQGGRVSGVVNDEDGHPLKAATVSASSSGEAGRSCGPRRSSAICAYSRMNSLISFGNGAGLA